MFARVLGSALLFLGASSALGQQAMSGALPQPPGRSAEEAQPESGWLDLRQNAAAHATPQSVPSWVESVSLVSAPAQEGAAAKTIFRIRVSRPRQDFQVLFFRLFFDDKKDHQPAIVAWDESGTQVLRSGPLGSGLELAISDTAMVPMLGVSCLDVEVPGDGATIRGAYIEWMTNSEVLHPVSAPHRDVIPEPFAAAAPLHAPRADIERFGSVTATLAAETIRIGASIQQGAAFQFGIEAQPLVALLSFEVASPKIDAPPEVYVNGASIGPVMLTLPDLADPAYRGEAERLVSQMRFQYTGWLRAQKLVPVANLKVGTNDILVIGGPGTPACAIRGTQIQLKYLWDKSDYLLRPDR